jgi:hypothetical protein
LNIETLIHAAESDGLQIEVTERLTVKVEGSKPAIEKWATQLREHKAEIVALLQGQQQHAMHLAQIAIEQAALTDEQKASRLADLKRDPAIATFWAQIIHGDQLLKTTTARGER